MRNVRADTYRMSGCQGGSNSSRSHNPFSQSPAFGMYLHYIHPCNSRLQLHCLIMSVEFPNKFVILALGITRQQFHRGVKVIQTLLAMFKIDRCY